MSVYRLDCDMNGTDSIEAYIASGQIVNLACPTFEEMDRHRTHLQETIKPGDWVLYDTMSTMLSTTRADRVLGNNVNDKLWDPVKVAKYFGDKEYLAVYNMSTQLNLRTLKNLRARGARIICLCHEDEVTDPMAGMKMAGPQVNPAMVGELIAASSDVFRLVALTEDIIGDNGKVLQKAGTRVLYLRRTDSFTAKFHVAREISDSIPRAMINPTLQDLWKVLDKQSSWLTIYGHPGAGKTSLAATVADIFDEEQVPA